MDVGPGDEPRQRTQSTQNHSILVTCLLRLKDRHENLEVRWLSEEINLPTYNL